MYTTAPASPPQDLQTTILNSTSILFMWREPRSDDQNGLIRLYLINVTEIETGVNWQLMSNDRNVTVQSLHPFYSYTLVVAAQTLALGPFSSPIQIEMPEDGWYHYYKQYSSFITDPLCSIHIQLLLVHLSMYLLPWSHHLDLFYHGIIPHQSTGMD